MGRDAVLRAVVTVVASTGLLAARAQRVVGQADAHAAHWRARATRPGELTYLALGDSLTAGIGARDPEQGLVGLVAARLAAARATTVRVVNLGVSGATLADLLAEQLPRARRVLDAGPVDLVTVCIGANDAGTTDPAAFAAGLTELLAALPDGALVSDVPSFQGGHRAAEAAELARTARTVLAAHPRLVAVGVEAATTGMGVREFSGDLFHPGPRGYRRYADAFWAALVSARGRAPEPPTGSAA
ncbi:SGNH/GDSL hydrolase family protein [Rhodococcus aerolatus]